MTLRQRILVVYSLTLLVALAMVGFWSWFEFEEQRQAVLRGGVGAMLHADPLEEALEILFYGGLPAVILGLIGGTFMIRRALGPIRDLTEVLENTTTLNLADAVPRSGNGDEIDRMTAVFNGMKDRLSVSFTQAREFTLHASHELKTPLTIMHGTLEQMLDDRSLSGSQQERIASMLEEVQRLSGIVGQLTFLAKADAGQLESAKGAVALQELVGDLVEDLTILSAAQDITVCLEACHEAAVEGDRMRLRQLLLILGDNAVKHNQAGGSISLGLRAAGGQAVLEVINTGALLPRELHSRVFERFFRGDVAHGTIVEGSGLGLSIARSIAESHGGGITMDATGDGRTRVTVRLPAVSRT
tara:strand:- start:122 stop:1195 length:1074 start_codon:yes stop_codon:yes gene_type:complete